MHSRNFTYFGLAAASIAAITFTACGFSSTSSWDEPPDRGSEEDTYYYKIDTESKQVRQHSNGQCLIDSKRMRWDPTADIDEFVYDYTFSNDTLYLKNSGGESVLVRTSGTPGELDGTWRVARYYNGLGYEVPGESSGLTANRVITISGDSFKETSELASTFDFTRTFGMQLSMTAVFDAQDGQYNGPGAASIAYFSEPVSNDPMMYEYTIVNRTNTSIEILRNGRTFLLEVVNPKLGYHKRSVTYKLTSNGRTCTSVYETFSITEKSCSLNYHESVAFSNSDGVVYSAETYNGFNSDFEKCFKKMFGLGEFD